MSTVLPLQLRKRHGSGRPQYQGAPRRIRSTHFLSHARDAYRAMDDLQHIRARRASRRLATSIRHAALHATPKELVDLDRLLLVVRNGHITADQAVERIHDLRRTQESRRAA